MPLKKLDHVSILTTKLEETREFYEFVMGMKVGERPSFPFPGHWLYLASEAVIHLVGIDAKNPDGLIEYLGQFDIENLFGSGAVDHLAFLATNPDEYINKLKKLTIPYRERKVPNMNLFQIFVEDPNKITLELNYWD